MPEQQEPEQQEPEQQKSKSKTKSKSCLAKELENNLGSYWNLNISEQSASYANTYLAASQLTKPQTYEQATSSPEANKWKEAMNNKYASLIKNKTWDLMDLLPDKNLIPT